MKSILTLASELRSENVRNVFNAIDGDFISPRRFEYSDLADTILEIVERYATGFVTDIAKRYRLTNARVTSPMSDKQRWCIAFAFQKITDAQISEYSAYLAS